MSVEAKHYNLILSPVITEKATYASENNQVVFRVRNEASKPEIKEAIEAIFRVKVKSVNTIVQKGKSKRFRNIPYKRKDVKKAIVTLEEGHSIDVTSGL